MRACAAAARRSVFNSWRQAGHADSIRARAGAGGGWRPAGHRAPRPRSTASSSRLAGGGRRPAGHRAPRPRRLDARRPSQEGWPAGIIRRMALGQMSGRAGGRRIRAIRAIKPPGCLARGGRRMAPARPRPLPAARIGDSASCAIALKNSPHAVRPRRRQCPRCARLNFQVLAVANTMLNMSRFMPASDAPLEEAGRLGPRAEMRAGSAPNAGEAGGGRRAGCRMVRTLRLRALARYRRGGSLARHGNFQASVIWMPHIRRS